MQTPESSHQGDLQQTMQSMLAENAKAAEGLVAGAQQAREEVAADRAAARQALLETEQNAEALSAAFYHQHRIRIEKDLRAQLNRRFIIALLQQGIAPDEVAALLNVPEAQALELARHFGYFEWKDEKFGAPSPDINWYKMDTSYARLSYEDQGRGGNVILHLGTQVYRFWYEFAGGSALVFIDVPAAEHWEKQTGIPLADREKILHFMGERAVADKAPGHRYRIEATSIVIF